MSIPGPDHSMTTSWINFFWFFSFFFTIFSSSPLRANIRKCKKQKKKYFHCSTNFPLDFFFHIFEEKLRCRKKNPSELRFFSSLWKIKNITCNKMRIFSIYGCDTKKKTAEGRMLRRIGWMMKIRMSRDGNLLSRVF